MPEHSPSISLNFMPAFYHRHIGTRYGEAYLFDPVHRAAVQCAEERFLYEALGRYGVGSSRPEPIPSLFIQPIELIMRTQGAEWRFPEDGTLESWGAPWRGLSIQEIGRIEAAEVARHPVIDALLEQYRALERLYGERADLFGLKAGQLNIHAPYTTAHQLRGEELFVELLTDEEATTVILNKVWEIYRAIFDRLSTVLKAHPSHLHMGDCSASMLSPDTYLQCVLPMNRRIAASFTTVSYHSCGPSSHLLSAFQRLPPLEHIELGAGTDLASAVRDLPATPVFPLIDPVMMRERNPDEIRDVIVRTISAVAPAPAATLCVWSLDRDTPLANVEAVYDAVKDTHAHP